MFRESNNSISFGLDGLGASGLTIFPSGSIKIKRGIPVILYPEIKSDFQALSENNWIPPNCLSVTIFCHAACAYSAVPLRFASSIEILTKAIFLSWYCYSTL